MDNDNLEIDFDSEDIFKQLEEEAGKTSDLINLDSLEIETFDLELEELVTLDFGETTDEILEEEDRFEELVGFDDIVDNMSTSEVEMGVRMKHEDSYNTYSNPASLNLFFSQTPLKDLMKMLLDPEKTSLDRVSGNPRVKDTMEKYTQSIMNNISTEKGSLLFNITRGLTSSRASMGMPKDAMSGVDIVDIPHMNSITAIIENSFKRGKSQTEINQEVSKYIDELALNPNTALSVQSKQTLNKVSSVFITSKADSINNREGIIKLSRRTAERFTEIFSDSIEYISTVIFNKYIDMHLSLDEYKKRLQSAIDTGMTSAEAKKLVKYVQPSLIDDITLIQGLYQGPNSTVLAECRECKMVSRHETLMAEYRVTGAPAQVIILGLVCPCCNKMMFLSPSEYDYLKTTYKSKKHFEKRVQAGIRVYIPTVALYEEALPRAWKELKESNLEEHKVEYLERKQKEKVLNSREEEEIDFGDISDIGGEEIDLGIDFGIDLDSSFDLGLDNENKSKYDFEEMTAKMESESQVLDAGFLRWNREVKIYRDIIDGLMEEKVTILDTNKYTIGELYKDEETNTSRMVFPAVDDFRESADINELVKNLAMYLTQTYLGSYNSMKKLARDTLGETIGKDPVLRYQLIPSNDRLIDTMQHYREFEFPIDAEYSMKRVILNRMEQATNENFLSAISEEGFDKDRYEELVNKFINVEFLELSETIKNLSNMGKAFGMLPVDTNPTPNVLFNTALEFEEYSRLVDVITDYMLIAEASSNFFENLNDQTTQMYTLNKVIIAKTNLYRKGLFGKIITAHNNSERASQFYNLFNKINNCMEFNIYGKTYRDEYMASMENELNIPPEGQLFRPSIHSSLANNVMAWYEDESDINAMYYLRVALFLGDRKLIEQLIDISNYMMNIKHYHVDMGESKNPFTSTGFPGTQFSELKKVLYSESNKIGSQGLTHDDLEEVLQDYYQRRFAQHYGEELVKKNTQGIGLRYIPQLTEEEYKENTLEILLEGIHEMDNLPSEYTELYALLTGFTTYYNPQIRKDSERMLVYELLLTLMSWGPFMLPILGIDTEIFKLAISSVQQDSGAQSWGDEEKLALACSMTLSDSINVLNILDDFTEKVLTHQLDMVTEDDEESDVVDDLTNVIDIVVGRDSKKIYERLIN